MPKVKGLPVIFNAIIVFCTVAISISVEVEAEVKVKLRQCEQFMDTRNDTSEDLFITIPGNLTNTDETVDFEIEKHPYKLPCKRHFTQEVKWEHGSKLTRTKSDKRGTRLKNSGKLSSHFTHGGYFHLSQPGHYYKPDDYCIKTVSDSAIELQVCDISCTDSDRICIPKCCGVDEILVYWNFTCRKLTPTELQWKPMVHRDNYPYKKITKQTDLDKIHFHRKKLDCLVFETYPLSDVIRPKKPEYYRRDKANYWKFLESERPVFLAQDRKWYPIADGDYCIDGFANWGLGGNGSYLGDEDEYSVLLLCPSGNSTGFGPEFSESRAWTYSIALIFSSLFLLLTVIVHLLLIDKQHLHGLTVLCHSSSMFFLYVFFAIAHIISIFPTFKGYEEREPFCMVVAILSHYFFMSTFVWLTIMNGDLFFTFRSMRPVSKMSKKIRRFWLYFAIGWGLPALLSASFYGVDHVFRDLRSEVVVPDYAAKSCFVAIWSRGHYMYSLVAIALGINTVLVAWTFHIFYDFRKQNANIFSSKRAKSDKYSVRLFIKLFCVMGVAWFVELLSWKYNGMSKPWIVVVFDLIMFLQAVAIFVIFCINRRTLAQLEEKYVCLRRTIRPIRKMSLFKWTSDVDGVEMTTPGSTPRKLSMSVTTKMDSTLPRKASTSSARSVATTNKGFLGSNGKMESISLDSDTEAGVIGDSKQENIVNHAPDLLINT